MKGILFSIFLLGSFTLKAQPDHGKNKMLIGKWKYDVTYDTVVVAGLVGEEKPSSKFFSVIRIKKRTAYLKNGREYLYGKWENRNSNELYFYLVDGTVLRYSITNLTKSRLELKELGSGTGSYGYKKN